MHAKKTLFMWHKAQTSLNSLQTHQNMFLRSKSVKNVFHVGKRGKGCSKKDNAEDSVT